jgi:Cdc6-like AAA superfamily ATPase
MSTADDNIMNHFGLRRRNFILDPHDEADSTFWAERAQPNRTRIVEELQIDLEAGLAPKRLFWGPYGGGKTHTLENLTRSLEKMTDIYSVYVESPTMEKKSTFLVLYRSGIMKSIGQDLTLSIFNKIVDMSVGEGGRSEVLEKLKRTIGDEELSMAVLRFLDPQFDPLLFWSWFSGASVPRGQLSILNQTNDLTEAEPAYLATLLVILARLYRLTHNKLLVLILDELEHLQEIGVDGSATFQTAFIRLTDPNQNDLGVLMAYSADVWDRLPDMFRGPVQSRLGTEAYIEIPSLVPKEAETFMRLIIQYVRDPSANVADLAAKARQATREKVIDDIFPFSQEAFEKLLSQVPSQFFTPREIMHRMTRAVSRAFITKRLIVTSDIVV